MRSAQPYSTTKLSAARPQLINETARALFDGRHAVENRVLAETASHKLNAGRQVFEKIYRYHASGESEIVHTVAVDRCVEEIFRLHFPLYIVVPRIHWPHEEGCQYEWIGIQKQAPGAHDSSSVRKSGAIAVKIEDGAEFVIPAKDPAHLVASKLLDGRTKCGFELREQHSEPASRCFHDRWWFNVDDVISRVTQVTRRTIDQPADARMDWISVTVARNCNANRLQQRLAVEWRWHPPRIARIAPGHNAGGKTHVVHRSRNRPLHRCELGEKAALHDGRRIECGDTARGRLKRRHTVRKSRKA